MLESASWRTVVVLLALCGLVADLFAKEPAVAKPGCTRALTIAVSPLGSSMVIQADGQFAGTTRQIFDRLAKDTACSFEYVVVPRARAFSMLRSGDVDMVPDATLTPERLDGAQFVEAGRIIPAVISLERNPVQFASIEDMYASSATLVTINGHDYGKVFQSILHDPRMRGRISTVTSPENAIKVLVSGRAQAILTGPVTIIGAWEQFGGDAPLRIAQVPDMPSIAFGLYMSTRRMAQSDRDQVEQALQVLLRNGEAARLSVYAFPEWFRAAFKPVISSAKPPPTAK